MVKNGASILDFIHFVQRIHFCSKKGYFNKQNRSPWVFFIFEKISRGKSKPFLFVHVWIFPTAARFTGHFSGGILNLSRGKSNPFLFVRVWIFPMAARFAVHFSGGILNFWPYLVELHEKNCRTIPKILPFEKLEVNVCL